MYPISFSVLICSLLFYLAFSPDTLHAGNMLPLFSLSRNHIYCLGTLVLLTEFSYVTWKVSFTFFNNIKE